VDVSNGQYSGCFKWTVQGMFQMDSPGDVSNGQYRGCFKWTSLTLKWPFKTVCAKQTKKIKKKRMMKLGMRKGNDRTSILSYRE
jgi:hypothetical protein